MPSPRPMIGAVIVLSLLLSACPGKKSSNDKPARVTDGKELFSTYCARCHGPDGRGGPATEAAPGPRNFHDHAFQTSRTDEQLRAVIVGGKGTAMPAFGSTFDDEQLASLLSHLRKLDTEK